MVVDQRKSTGVLVRTNWQTALSALRMFIERLCGRDRKRVVEFLDKQTSRLEKQNRSWSSKVCR